MPLKGLMNISKIISTLAAALWFIASPHADAALPDASAPGTLAHHLVTNAATRGAKLPPGYNSEIEIQWPRTTNANDLSRFTNATWSSTFWLKNVIGLSATPIGFTNVFGGQGLPTMISPRHYICATHMHAESYTIAFMDPSQHVYFRKTVQRLDVTNDISVGIIDKDLPPSVGYLPLLPDNYTNYLPTEPTSLVQGIGMNQDFCLFSQPMNLAFPTYVAWNSARQVPGGPSTNWNVTLRGGDSSNPDMLLIGNQLVLVSHNASVGGGPNYAFQFPAINRAMHQLSQKNHVGSDYQITEYSLTNWPVIK